MSPTFDIDLVRRHGATILIVVGEIDLATSPRLDHRLARVLAGESGKVVVDLDRVTFIDGSGIAVLARHARSHERLRIGPMSRQVERMFALAGMRGRLPMASCC
jgi:anti-sigma B factor antagonist